MEQLLGLVFRLKGDVYAQLFEQILVHMGENDGGVGLTTLEIVQLFYGAAGHGIGHRTDGQGYEQLVGVETGIMISQMLYLQMLDGLDNAGGYQRKLLVYTRQGLYGIEQAGGRSAQKGGGLAGDYAPVVELQSYGGAAGLFRLVQSGGNHGPVAGGKTQRVHDEFYLSHLTGIGGAPAHAAGGGIVAAEYLLPGGLHADLIVLDAEAQHVYPHVCGTLVGAGAVDAFEYCFQHREDLHVPVVVDGGDAIGLQMEGVYHVHVVQVGGGSLIGQVYRMLERQVPHREGLKLGIACADATLVLVIELT